MTPLYTVYTLMDPDEPQVVRYVGVTTQALQKRLHDMYSCCTKQHFTMYTTPVGEWLRGIVESGNKPLVTVQYEGEDKQISNQAYCDAVNDNVHTGFLLNSVPGKKPGVRTKAIDGIGPSGKPVDPNCEHAQASLRRKLNLANKS